MSVMAASELYDLTIIGAGPTGLFASYYAPIFARPTSPRSRSTLVSRTIPAPDAALTCPNPHRLKQVTIRL